LAAHLFLNFSDPKVRAAEYHYFDKKYGISEVSGELPICLFSMGYKIFSQNQYRPFFESIEKQNYSNYKVVLIDDASPDQTAENLYRYLLQ
jgi:hypothetical protein